MNRKEKVEVDRVAGVGAVRREVVQDTGKESQATLVRVVQIMWLFVIALEILLGLRVLLKLAAADPSVPFAAFIYNLSAIFVAPFAGLTITPAANGVVFEVPTIFAMAAYVLFGWLLTQLVWLVFKPAKHRSVSTYEESSR
jgi:hypothetical protein